MRYSSYRYIYPPRPKNAIPQEDLRGFDNGSMIAQPKLDGSNLVLFTDGKTVHAMNRHGERITRFEIPNEEVLSLYRGTGGWTVLNGEYMNKNKRDASGRPFNHKLVIFDILVDDGDYLIGKTFEARQSILTGMFGERESDHDYLFSVSESVYRVKSYLSGFSELYRRLVEIDMVEGFVLKRKAARLEMGNTELNNTKSQVKCRKATKNYKF